MFENKKIHMIGIGGISMSGIAGILLSFNCKITGYDAGVTDITKSLNEKGIEVSNKPNLENVKNADIVVYTAAIHEDNEELKYARENNKLVFERSTFLGILMKEYENVLCISGTHGKSTTTGMVSTIFVKANLNPTIMIGAHLPIINSNYNVGTKKYFIAESCEYVDSFLDFYPTSEIVLDIDDDHLDYFKTIENLTLSFHKFVSMATRVYFNGDDPLCHKAVTGVNGTVTTFGLNQSNHYYAKGLEKGERGPRFTVFKAGQPLGQLELEIPGRHNVYNALAAVAVCTDLGLQFNEIKKPLECFTGAGRRFERYGEFNGITLVDDYAHHPTELEATLTAAKNLKHQRVVAVFQPFTFSRTALLKNDFIKALKIADEVILTPIMGSREVNTYGISSNDLAAELPHCTVVEDFDGVVAAIEKIARPGDLVITMGGGDIYKAAQKYAAKHKVQ